MWNLQSIKGMQAMLEQKDQVIDGNHKLISDLQDKHAKGKFDEQKSYQLS
jgi:hypothetical protein